MEMTLASSTKWGVMLVVALSLGVTVMFINIALWIQMRRTLSLPRYPGMIPQTSVLGLIPGS